MAIYRSEVRVVVLTVCLAWASGYATFSDTFTTSYPNRTTKVLKTWMDQTIQVPPVPGKAVRLVIAVDNNVQMGQGNLQLTKALLENVLSKFDSSTFNTSTTLVTYNSQDTKLVEVKISTSNLTQVEQAIANLSLPTASVAERRYLANYTEELRMANNEYILMVICSPSFLDEDINFKMRFDYGTFDLYQLTEAVTTNSYHVIQTGAIGINTNITELENYISNINPRFDADNFYNYIV